jgi:hypothetical protein
MHRRHLALLLFVLVFLAGCPVPWDRLEGCAEFDACSTSEPAGSTSTGAEFPTTATPTTGDESAGDPSGSSAAPDTDEPLSPPVILSVELPELPITTCGGYPLLAHTLHADGVRLTAEDGEVIDLSQVGPDTFTGELIALTGLDNGAHVAELVPWRDGILGQSELVDYEISLPDAGSERYWDAGALLGKGVVASLGILPDGRVVDFGTIYDAMNVPGCYLRVHDAEGMWSETDDVVRLLPGQHCQAVDLTIDPDSGILHVLAHRETMDGVRWWVGQVAGWGAGLKTVATGPLDVQAQALAAHPEMIAVCGARTAPEGIGDLDAFAVLLRPGQADEERLYDYEAPGQPEHAFSETVYDCIFAANTLVLVGEAYGKHDEIADDKRDRLLLIEDDVLAGTEKLLTVAGPGPGTQSRAYAVTVDDEGRYLVAGSFCFDECEPAGELRRYEPGGEMTWQASLGPLGSEWFGPHGIAWSPAGYVVIARGRLQAQAWAFTVEAYAPDKPGTPLWSYTPMFADGQQLAVDVVVGDCGTVHAGGLGASNYPAIAGVNG